MEQPTLKEHRAHARRPALTSAILDSVFPFRVREFLRGVHDRRHLNALIREDAEYTFAPFLKYQCLFIHIPKAAGLSVAQSLFGCKAGGHRSLTRYRAALGRDFVDHCLKFAIVRNPWDRLVSAYFFLKKGGISPNDAYWSQQHLQRFERFDDFVTSWLTRTRVEKEQHFVPQRRFLVGREGRIGVDYVGRVENLQEDFAWITGRLGISARLAELNRSEHGHYRDYYSRRTRRIVGEIYREDVETFDYDF